MKKRTLVSILILIGIFGFGLGLIFCKGIQLLTATPNLAGRSGIVAAHSVFKIQIPSKETGGTAFLHKSGKVITAAHVVEDASPADVIIIDSQGEKYQVESIICNTDYDLALLTLTTEIEGSSLPISTKTEFAIGAQVSTWGYPAGYTGSLPLLSVGYLSGKEGNTWVVNAAFNKGNSGGPLIQH